MAMTEPNPAQRCWTKRQREVLDLLARERTNAQVAEALGVSLAGAKWHVSEVLSILGVSSREEAAEYWRQERALHRRAGRMVRAISASLFSLKTVAATTGLAACVGGAAVIFAIPGLAGTDSATPAAIAETPPENPADLQYIELAHTGFPNGEVVTLYGSLGDTLCFKTVRSSAPNLFGVGCYGPRNAFDGALLMGFGSEGFHGAVQPGTDHVEIEIYGEPTLVVPVVAPDPSFGVDREFWIASVAQVQRVAAISAVGADGAVLDRVTLFDPPGTPPRAQVTAPLSDLVLVGSNRPDLLSGTNPYSGSRAGAIAVPDGGEYRFRVEHDGSLPLDLHFWCQSGVLPLTWESGPDAASNGTISAHVPPNSAGCFFLVGGGNGNFRITTTTSP